MQIRSAAAQDSLRSASSTVNHACEESRSSAPCENRTSEKLRRSRGRKLGLESGGKHRLSSAVRFDCTEIIINQSFADSNQNPLSE